MESVLALSIYEDGDENLKEGTNQLPSTTRATAGAVAGLDAAKEVAPDGRVRTFPHVKGNYPGFVFVSISTAPDVLALAAAQACAAAELVLGPKCTVHRLPLSELHLSLSRTFAVRRPDIEPLVQLLADNLRALPRFSGTLRGAELYTNEDATRTFVGLRLASGEQRMHALVRGVDRSLSAFRIPAYYSELSFHVSVAWAAGGLQPGTSRELRVASDGKEGEKVHFDVDTAKAKIGARSYRFDLQC
jgi:hypothetical protein